MPTYTAGDVMLRGAVLLNDSARRLYTDINMLPYLQIAVDEVEQEFNLNEVETNWISEAIISVAIGATSLSLPASFFLPISLRERKAGTIDFSDMTYVGNIHKMNYAANQSLSYWDFRHNCVNFTGKSTQINEVRLEYWRVLTAIDNEGDDVALKGAKNALAFRTAALCAENIGKNFERSGSLNAQGQIALDRIIALYVKNNQNNRIRRKPFRATTGRRGMIIQG